jgi:ribonuclease P protein component
MRLKKAWEFDAVFRTGRQLRGELVRICFLQRGSEPARTGVAVGKRIAGAVGRAHGRRLLRESARRLIPWVKDGLWLVMSLRERALQESAAAVYADAAGLLERAGLLTESWDGADWQVDTSCGKRTSPSPPL